MISVITYGAGNVGSIFNMLRKIDVQCAAASTPSEVARAEKLILPGVGAFDNGMRLLLERDLVEAIHASAARGTPLLGICLGMQLLGRRSEEGELPGIGLLDAGSVRFRATETSQLKVPHMGWRELEQRREDPLLVALDERARFYFVHAYHMVCSDSSDILATAHYGSDFAAVVQRGNVWGAQFHPEKSHRFGMTLLRNFARI